ncbi:hypothetical protein BJX64DRAFT_120512 [Aspergillus heterothallicus]
MASPLSVHRLSPQHRSLLYISPLVGRVLIIAVAVVIGVEVLDATGEEIGSDGGKLLEVAEVNCVAQADAHEAGARAVSSV